MAKKSNAVGSHRERRLAANNQPRDWVPSVWIVLGDVELFLISKVGLPYSVLGFHACVRNANPWLRRIHSICSRIVHPVSSSHWILKKEYGEATISALRLSDIVNAQYERVHDMIPIAASDSTKNMSEPTHVPAEFVESATIMQAADAKIRKALVNADITWQDYPCWDSSGNADGSAIAKAYSMQGILKYHGMADWHWRTAFIPSISVNNDAAYTITRVDFRNGLRTDTLTINGDIVTGRPLQRVVRVLDHVRALSNSTNKASVKSMNVMNAASTTKGLGTSAAAGAALAMAALEATLGQKASENMRLVSSTARLLAGSACRSAVGGIALWLSYPGVAHNKCFAVRLDSNDALADLRLITVPLESRSGLQTEQAHHAAPTSSFFQAWLHTRPDEVISCLQATSSGDWETICQLAELDSLRLHGVTMAANLEQSLLTWEPENISLFNMCRRLREQGVPVYFSTDTGPTTVLMTNADSQNEVMENITSLEIGVDIISGGIGGPATLIQSDDAKNFGI